jgi:flagellar L-ring protein precursor FlgH
MILKKRVQPMTSANALRALIALMTLPLASCSTVTSAVNSAVSGPQMAPMSYPAQLVPQYQQVYQQPTTRETGAASANSLWRTGARAFFIDQRASRVGDILTVQIDIDDSADVSNATDRSRTGSTNGAVTNVFGLESILGRFIPPGTDLTQGLGYNGSTTGSGSGSVKRQEKISLTVAALVSQVLPNGNMIIQGRQEVRTNGEIRELTVAGIVRPEDITSSNTIKHTQIAEARIAYGGRGDISRMQKTPAGQALIETFSPF